jgi:hypothetical protein
MMTRRDPVTASHSGSDRSSRRERMGWSPSLRLRTSTRCHGLELGLDGASTAGLGRSGCPLRRVGDSGSAGDAVGWRARAEALQGRDPGPRHPHVGQTAVCALTARQHVDPICSVWREEEFRRLARVEGQDERHGGTPWSVLEAGSVGRLVGPGPGVMHASGPQCR